MLNKLSLVSTIYILEVLIDWLTVYSYSSENGYNDRTDADIIQQQISKETIKHHVRRITYGSMKTFRLVDHALLHYLLAK